MICSLCSNLPVLFCVCTPTDPEVISDSLVAQVSDTICLSEHACWYWRGHCAWSNALRFVPPEVVAHSLHFLQLQLHTSHSHSSMSLSAIKLMRCFAKADAER